MPSHKTYALVLTSEVEPNSYAHASIESKWIAAIELELNALNVNKTWEFVTLPLDVVPITIGIKWVYKIKRHAYGTVERYKVHLVAQGFTKTEGLDYFET